MVFGSNGTEVFVNTSSFVYERELSNVMEISDKVNRSASFLIHQIIMFILKNDIKHPTQKTYMNDPEVRILRFHGLGDNSGNY